MAHSCLLCRWATRDRAVLCRRMPQHPIFRAVKVEDVRAVSTWAHDSADPNIDDGSPKRTTPLHWAAYLGSQAVVAVLLEHPQIDVNRTEVDGKTALHWAAFEGHTTVVRQLLDAGANALVADSLRSTPCHLAVLQHHDETARVLPNYHQVVDAAGKARRLVSEPRQRLALDESPIQNVPRSLSPPGDASSAAPEHNVPAAHQSDTQFDESSDGDTLYEREQRAAMRTRRLDHARDTPSRHAASRTVSDAQASEAELERQRSLVERDDRHRDGSEFGALDSMLATEREDQARVEQRYLDKEQRRIDRLERRVARKEAKRQQRLQWLEQVMRVAAASRDISREDYMELMQQVAARFVQNEVSPIEQSAAPFERQHEESEVPRDAAELPQPIVPPLHFMAWDAGTLHEAVGGRSALPEPSSHRDPMSTAHSSSARSRSSRVREPSTRHPPDVQPRIALDVRRSASRGRSASSHWCPPAATRIEEPVYTACCVTKVVRPERRQQQPEKQR